GRWQASASAPGRSTTTWTSRRLRSWAPGPRAPPRTRPYRRRPELLDRVPLPGDDLQVAHVDAQAVEGPLEQRAAEPVATHERLLGYLLTLGLDDGGARLERRAQRLAADRAGRHQDARVFAQALDLAGGALAAHIEAAVGLRCPDGRRDRDTAAAERGQQRALVRAELIDGAGAGDVGDRADTRRGGARGQASARERPGRSPSWHRMGARTSHFGLHALGIVGHRGRSRHAPAIRLPRAAADGSCRSPPARAGWPRSRWPKRPPTGDPGPRPCRRPGTPRRRDRPPDGLASWSRAGRGRPCERPSPDAVSRSRALANRAAKHPSTAPAARLPARRSPRDEPAFEPESAPRPWAPARRRRR